MIQLISGVGGSVPLRCAPGRALGSGQTLAGTTSTLPITCTKQPPHFLSLNLTGALSASPFFFGASSTSPSIPIPPAAWLPGQSVQVDVSYHPTRNPATPGMLTDRLTVARLGGLQIPLGRCLEVRRPSVPRSRRPRSTSGTFPAAASRRPCRSRSRTWEPTFVSSETRQSRAMAAACFSRSSPRAFSPIPKRTRSRSRRRDLQRPRASS